jgi:hypothetical protein
MVNLFILNLSEFIYTCGGPQNACASPATSATADDPLRVSDRVRTNKQLFFWVSHARERQNGEVSGGVAIFVNSIL